MQIKKEKINPDNIRMMMKKQKWRQCDICESVLGIKQGTFSSSLGRGRMRSDVIDKLAAIFKVNRNFLLADDFLPEDEVEIETEKEKDTADSGTVLSCHDVEYVKCIYNLATGMEAVLTNFRQDLLGLIGGEVSDG